MSAVHHIDRDEPSRWGIPASIIAHGLLVAALILSPAAPRLSLPHEANVAVDILTPQQFRAMAELAPTEPPAPIPPAEPVPPLPAPAAVPKVETGIIVARTMLSEKTLADPRSRQARRELATFADSERIVQLCNLEAMDQVQAWRDDFHPDRLVAYARSDAKMSGETIAADGAAFRSRGNWYDIRFECQVSPDHGKVVAFRFEVGNPVPRKEWDELGLPAVH